MTLLPIMEPTYNLREAVKQMILLEDHLAHVRKRCPDCINKHLLTIEALAEEIMTLDKTGEYHQLGESLADQSRAWGQDLKNGTPEHQVAQAIRAVRKELMPQAMAVKVAHRWLNH